MLSLVHLHSHLHRVLHKNFYHHIRVLSHTAVTRVEMIMTHRISVGWSTQVRSLRAGTSYPKLTTLQAQNLAIQALQSQASL